MLFSHAKVGLTALLTGLKAADGLRALTTPGKSLNEPLVGYSATWGAER